MFLYSDECIGRRLHAKFSWMYPTATLIPYVLLFLILKMHNERSSNRRSEVGQQFCRVLDDCQVSLPFIRAWRVDDCENESIERIVKSHNRPAAISCSSAIKYQISTGSRAAASVRHLRRIRDRERVLQSALRAWFYRQRSHHKFVDISIDETWCFAVMTIVNSLITPFIYLTFNSTLRGYVLAMFGMGNTVVPTGISTSKVGSAKRN